MKIIVISDTHGDISLVQERISLLKPDAVIHLGDYVRDADLLRGLFPNLKIYSVRGNCDRGSLTPDEMIIDLEGVRIFAAHGHNQGVKDSLYGIYFAALDNEADIALFGHTHFPYNREKDGILLLNPGSAGYDRPTIAVMILEQGRMQADILNIG